MDLDISADASSTRAPAAAGVLHLVEAADWSSLVAAVAAHLARPLPDPFAIDVVCLEGAGHRRHLSQALALAGGPAGVSAGVDFVPLGQLRRRLEADLLGAPAELDPWRGRGLSLAIDEVLAGAIEEPWLAPVRHHLGEEWRRPGRRIATASRLARIFRRYLVQLPELLAGWSGGGSGGPDGAELPDHLAWQPELWRRVGELLRPASDPLVRHRELVTALAGRQVGWLAGRLTVISRDGQPGSDLDLVLALARSVEVSVFQLAAVDQDGEPHPLAAHLGQVQRAAIGQWRSVSTSRSARHAVRPEPTTLLRRVQSDIRTGTRPRPHPGRTADGSIQIHASHGPDRQVEVLREVLTGLFADDPSLEPREVVVACADLDAYASLVSAAFGLDHASMGTNLHPGHSLRLQLAQHSLTRLNPVLVALRAVLGLAFNRATSADLLELCAAGPIATKFGLSEDDLAVLERLISNSGIRWGIDKEHRSAQGLGGIVQGTWMTGLERMTLGVAMGEQPLTWLGTALPLAEVQSTEVELVGRFGELISRIRFWLHECATSTDMTGWVVRLRGMLDSLTAVSPDDAWQLAHAYSELAELADRSSGRSARFALGEVVALLDQINGSVAGGRPNYGNGSLLVCGLDDLAGIAHRVVCLLGIDDEHFPRRCHHDGDDLLIGLPRPPHADPRALSRQHFLDAVLAAGERLIVITRGADERTNELTPASVTVLELIAAAGLDPALDAGWPRAHAGRTPAQTGVPLVRMHTLQPYDPLNFTASSSEPPFSFDQISWRGAQAFFEVADHGPQAGQPVWRTRLPSPLTGEPIALTDLVAFYRHPAQELLRRSVGVTMTQFDDRLQTQLPTHIGGLAYWRVGSRLVSGLLAGEDPVRLAGAEWLRGEVPPGELGRVQLAGLQNKAQQLADEAGQYLSEPARTAAVNLAVGTDRLVGTARLRGDHLVSHTFSAASGKELIQPWLTLVALAADPESPRGLQAVVIARKKAFLLRPPPPEKARDLLDQLVARYRRGLTGLLPLPPKLAAFHAGVPVPEPFGKGDPLVTLWAEERDANWAHFVGDTLAGLLAVDTGSGNFDTLAGWFWHPVRDAVSPLDPQEPQ